MTTDNRLRWRRIATSIAIGFILIASSALAGALLGTVFVRFFVPRTGMGWDQLADALGGLMLGAIIGLVAGIFATVRFDTRRRLVATAVAILIVAATVGILRLAAEPRQDAEPVVREQDFQPWFRVSVRVGHTEEVLNGVEPGDEPVPFSEGSIFTAIPELIHVGWGPEFRRCRAEPSVDDLNFLLPLVRAVSDEAAAGMCRTPRSDDLGVVMNFSREDGRGGGDRVESDCLVDRPALVNLANALQTVAARLCPLD
jgi:hypothetical protein